MTTADSIRQYVADMPYFMILSLHPILVGSSLCSYEMEVPCKAMEAKGVL